MDKYQLKLLPEEITFEAAPGEVILDAAIAQLVPIPYTCRNGTCRTCLVEVLSGDILAIEPEQCMISVEELHNNRRLLCMSTAQSSAVFTRVIRKKKSLSNDRQ